MLGSAVDDLFYLAPVDVEFASYRPLAVARLVPRSYRLFQGWRRRRYDRYVVVRCWRQVVRCRTG